jgi:NADH-quinone oxidoreductase subunit D
MATTSQTNQTSQPSTDPYATSGADVDAAGGAHVFNPSGGDWDELVEEASALHEERIVVNMGPQHPSTHGVLRLILELDGETVTEARAGIGYLHTGIEKNMEFRNWTQGVTFCTRMDYLTPMMQEAVYCLAIEKLLGITDQIPERASTIRVLMMELTRISSHLVALGTGGMEMGATTVMTVGFRERERLLSIIEMITGLRMNNAYIRPGGVAQDLPRGVYDKIRDTMPAVRRGIGELEALLDENPIVKGRMEKVGYLDLTGCMALGVTGPVLRAAGLPHDLRKAAPYCGYETYDFEVPTRTTCDAYGRLRVRIDEMYESIRIVEQATDRLQADPPGAPVMVADKKIAWPAQLAIGGDGMGNSLDHIRTIMGESMEALIHHFKLVTEGFRVPPGEVYYPIESPRGELACFVRSDGSSKPARVHMRDPSFVNLQATAPMVKDLYIADLIATLAALDPILGGIDR